MCGTTEKSSKLLLQNINRLKKWYKDIENIIAKFIKPFLVQKRMEDTTKTSYKN